MRTAACSMLMLALLLLLAVCGQAYKVAIPRSLLYDDEGYSTELGDRLAVIKKRSFDDVKRGGDRWMATVPRSGLMVGGRGWMPGFRSAYSSGDEVLLKVNEKHIPPLEQYNGYGVVGFNRLDNLRVF